MRLSNSGSCVVRFYVFCGAKEGCISFRSTEPFAYHADQLSFDLTSAAAPRGESRIMQGEQCVLRVNVNGAMMWTGVNAMNLDVPQE